MSFERAYKACRMCHKYNHDMMCQKYDHDKKLVKSGSSTSLYETNILANQYASLRDQANFEAMRATEPHPRVDSPREFHLRKEATRACVTCDYKSPRIAELVKCEVEEKPTKK